MKTSRRRSSPPNTSEGRPRRTLPDRVRSTRGLARGGTGGFGLATGPARVFFGLRCDGSRPFYGRARHVPGRDRPVVQTGASDGQPGSRLDTRRSFEGSPSGHGRRLCCGRRLPLRSRRRPGGAERPGLREARSCRTRGRARAPELPGDQVLPSAAGADLLAAQPAVMRCSLYRTAPTPCALNGGTGICVQVIARRVWRGGRQAAPRPRPLCASSTGHLDRARAQLVVQRQRAAPSYSACASGAASAARLSTAAKNAPRHGCSRGPAPWRRDQLVRARSGSSSKHSRGNGRRAVASSSDRCTPATAQPRRARPSRCAAPVSAPPAAGAGRRRRARDRARAPATPPGSAACAGP